ncbi:MAG TPA: FKBP-type peptidyl-prolyl cis-trans isomerase [Candidatus Nitrosotenuis sp.]|nr:FKBP-type peptidyl-prolyl cis-trans isomerase [Candidatus Nitrosotenuis sp.]
MNPDQQPQLEGTKLTGFDPVTSVQSLETFDTVEGTGDIVEPGATITAHYTGALCADGTIFQSSHDMGRPITFPLNGVIKGWQDGVPGMKVGGTRRLIIPAAQAYGSQSPSANIPANSDLVFDIELTQIN